jgi:hypothetical protein
MYVVTVKELVPYKAFCKFDIYMQATKYTCCILLLIRVLCLALWLAILVQYTSL